MDGPPFADPLNDQANSSIVDSSSSFIFRVSDRIGNLTYRITIQKLVVSTVCYNGLKTIETDRN
jgi:hypothetical protein